jgi:hypothetical protein
MFLLRKVESSLLIITTDVAYSYMNDSAIKS